MCRVGIASSHPIPSTRQALGKSAPKCVQQWDMHAVSATSSRREKAERRDALAGRDAIKYLMVCRRCPVIAWCSVVQCVAVWCIAWCYGASDYGGIRAVRRPSLAARQRPVFTHLPANARIVRSWAPSWALCSTVALFQRYKPATDVLHRTTADDDERALRMRKPPRRIYDLTSCSCCVKNCHECRSSRLRIAAAAQGILKTPPCHRQRPPDCLNLLYRIVRCCIMVFWNATCNSTLEEMRIESEEKLVGNFNFHELALIIAGGSTIIAYIVSFYLIWQHALNYTKPREQKQYAPSSRIKPMAVAQLIDDSIIRILFMVPIYATSSFLSLWYYWHAVYYRVISEAYEAFAIASFFALMCHLVAPDLHEQKQFFRQLQPIKPWLIPLNWFAKCCGGERGCWRTPKSGLTWFNIIWIGVYQYCFIRVAMTIVAVVTQHFDRYCESSNSPVFAHVWVIAIEAVAVTIAMYCLLQYYSQFRQPLSEHKLGLKVLAIKLVVFLSFWQTIAISLATSSTFHLVSANETLAYPDLKVGIPSLLLCIEMALFAVLHLWSFPYAQYREGAKTIFYPSPNPSSGVPPRENEHGPRTGGFAGIKAFGDALNLWDIAKAFGRGIRWLFVGVKHRHEDPSYQLKTDTGYPMPSHADGKSTDHLPIASQFRRSTFGLPNAPGDPMPEESAGLIANAQPDPGSGHRRQAHPYQDSVPASQAYNKITGPGPSSHLTTYTPYDDRGDIGAAGPQYYAYDAGDPYNSSEVRVPPGTGAIAAPQNPRNPAQARVGNALWGHQDQHRVQNNP
ncbi:hypothetical protein NUW58_g3053 [Xylaria curta]|uniref:Uncharacterized protein n=1 Tax=Xylaria curta TaxID=42375 RepID=A0ACC1PCS1_9PEZI|nr:hypothetical protein NUW58_g3053 [Xylaria curta]